MIDAGKKISKMLLGKYLFFSEMEILRFDFV
jgi:hypothetical protein